VNFAYKQTTSFLSSCNDSGYPAQTKLVAATSCRVWVDGVLGFSFFVAAFF